MWHYVLMALAIACYTWVAFVGLRAVERLCESERRDALAQDAIALPDEKAEWDAAFFKATGKHVYPSMTPCERRHQYVIGRRDCVMCGHLSTVHMPPVETGYLRTTCIPAEHMYRADIRDSMAYALMNVHKKEVAAKLARELDRALKTGISLHE